MTGEIIGVIVDEKAGNVATELVSVLEEEKQILSELVGITGEEQGALVSGRVDDLEAILRRKEIVIQRLKQAEVRRGETVRMLADYLGLEAEEASLRNLSACLDGPESDRLLELGLEVAEVSGRADNLNRVNAYLIGSSMNLLDTFLNRLVGWQDPSHVYQRAGAFKAKAKNNLFINREA